MVTENVYLAGNTVRLNCIFSDFSGVAVDPAIIKVKIYDQKYNVIQETNLSSANRDDVGVYYYDYTIPFENNNQKLYYEWYGEISGNPSLARGKFKIVFI